MKTRKPTPYAAPVYYSPEELKSAYEADLEADIRVDVERGTETAYTQKCRDELAKLRAAKSFRIVYGSPVL